MAEEEGLLNQDQRIKTSDLFVITKNEDGVTGFPYETPGFSEQITEIYQRAIESQSLLVFINGDIDKLSVINDTVGKPFANKGIKEIAKRTQRILAGAKGLEAVYLYRPQAGGDEFRAIVILEKSSANLSAEIIESLRKPLFLENESEKKRNRN